ncbi:MAG: hypothetical protein IJ151_04365 [Bacteroidales bacterium]|nr:hypothetical protein [Bacteroidales bacterium]
MWKETAKPQPSNHPAISTISFTFPGAKTSSLHPDPSFSHLRGAKRPFLHLTLPSCHSRPRPGISFLVISTEGRQAAAEKSLPRVQRLCAWETYAPIHTILFTPQCPRTHRHSRPRPGISFLVISTEGRQAAAEKSPFPVIPGSHPVILNEVKNLLNDTKWPFMGFKPLKRAV